jgi:hypothetical protein
MAWTRLISLPIRPTTTIAMTQIAIPSPVMMASRPMILQLVPQAPTSLSSSSTEGGFLQ